MYMSINGDNWVSSICLLTADDIEGPYEYQGVVVYSGMNNPNKIVDETQTDIYKVLGEGADLSRYSSTNESCINAIDPNVQEDENGDLYMTYGSWSAGIFQLKLDKSTGLRDYNTTYETKQDVSDAYFGTKIAGGYYCSGEGPYILKSGKYYYLFLSYANLEAVGGYQMRIYRSENISGPYVDQNGVSAIRDHNEDMKLKNYGIRIFGSYNMYGIGSVQVAQGHNSAFVDDDGKIFLVYHTRFQSNTGTSEFHQVRVHQMFVNEDGWLVAAPYEYTGETISEEGYAMEDMAGTYEFIYHEPTSYYKVVGDSQLGIVGKGTKAKKLSGEKEIEIGSHVSTVSYSVEFNKEAADTVTLHEDGTVTGEYQGTWTYDKSGMTIDLGNGKVYKGVFLKQANETMSHDMTMTFTAEGDNVTVWGVKALTEEKDDEDEE
jgi:arabinan endo-1,5-alpha-L-arabinosidase